MIAEHNSPHTTGAALIGCGIALLTVHDLLYAIYNYDARVVCGGDDGLTLVDLFWPDVYDLIKVDADGCIVDD